MSIEKLVIYKIKLVSYIQGMAKTPKPAVKKNSLISLNLNEEDYKVVDDIKAELETVFGKLPTTAVIRMSLRHYWKHLKEVGQG